MTTEPDPFPTPIRPMFKEPAPKPPANMIEVASMNLDGTMTLREGITEKELRQVIAMLAGLYHDLRMKMKDAAEKA